MNIKGWIRRDCPECKIKLIVREISKDAKNCALCLFKFPPIVKKKKKKK